MPAARELGRADKPAHGPARTVGPFLFSRAALSAIWQSVDMDYPLGTVSVRTPLPSYEHKANSKSAALETCPTT